MPPCKFSAKKIPAALTGLRVAAQVDDGKLDLIALKKCSASGLVALVKKILAGKSVEGDENIFSLQAATFKISTSAALTSDLDGEAGDPLPLKIETLRHALKIFY